jgi:4-amino-4-deoxy-L-arabinose transferase-like glycosyltransferase
MTSRLTFPNRHPVLCVFIVVIVCLLPIMLERDFTPSNELRYLSISNEAISQGETFAFTNHGIPYADKPPLFIWLIMLSRLLFGDYYPLALYLLSFIPACIIVYEMDKWLQIAGINLNSKDRVASAGMLLTTVIFLGPAVFLRMDMMMCMFIVLALLTFYKMYEGIGNRKSQSWMLPIWIFLALFTKGPVGLLVPVLSAVVFLLIRKEGREIGHYLGWKQWGVMFGLFALWMLGTYLDGGKAYIDNLLIHQTVGRAVNSFHHNRPFWFYFACIWMCLAPYCLVNIPVFFASVFGHRKDSQKRSDIEIFFCTIIAVTFILLSLFSSKIPIYLMPLVPFAVYLLPIYLSRKDWKPWMSWTLGIPICLLFVVSAGLIVALTGFKSEPHVAMLMGQIPFISSRLIMFALGTLALGTLISLLNLIIKGDWSTAVIYLVLAAFLGTYSASFEMDKVNDYVGYRNVCDIVPQNSHVVTLLMTRAENMDVYLGRQITDYHKNVTDFMQKEVNGKTTFGTTTLIVSTHKATRYPVLENFLMDPDLVVNHVGPYTVVTF